MIFKNVVFFCLVSLFTFTDSADPDEMQHYAAFHLGLHCLQKYSFRGSPNTKKLKIKKTKTKIDPSWVKDQFFYPSKSYQNFASDVIFKFHHSLKKANKSRYYM